MLSLGDLGMAARLSADLGLHLDLTKYNRRHLNLREDDLKNRRTSFWGVFIHER